MMQDNIRYYKRLEYEADLMEKRISGLQAIAEKYNSYQEEKQRLEIQSYIIDRARLQAILDEKAALSEDIGRLESEIASISKKQAECALVLFEERERRDRYIADKLKSDIHTKMEQLESQKNELIKRIDDLESDIEGTVQKLRRYAYEWREAAKRCFDLKNLPESEIRNLFSREMCDIESAAAVAQNHSASLLNTNHENLDMLTESQFKGINEDLSHFKQSATGLKYSIENKRKQFDNEIQELNKKLIELEKGIKSYDPKLIALRDAIKRN
jgi:chromosome segregation ATPase